MPAKPRWLLAIPDAIRQLEALDREVLTRGDVEQLFGVSRARAATLMQTFGAELTGNQRTLPRTQLLRQLRKHRTRAAFRGEATRRARVVTAIRQARLIGIRVTRCRGFDSYTDVLTEKGRRKPLARRCLAFFDRLG